MSSVNDWVVREYFESLGYLVMQPCKHVTSGRPKKVEEEIDMVVFNPHVLKAARPERMVWNADDLRGVPRAVVSVYGWHTDRFYPAMLERIPEILRLASEESLRHAERIAGARDVARILCLPQLPASDVLRENTLAMLRQMGVDGVLLFRTMLLELCDTVDKNRNYEKSDLLQVLRILKNYDLLKDRQMDLFGRKRRAQPAAGRAGRRVPSEPPEAPPAAGPEPGAIADE